jgi:hypothetical protein
MERGKCRIYLFTLLLLGFSPTLAPGQNAGFRVGMAPPAIAFPAPHSTVVQPHGTFTARPTFPPSPPPVLGTTAIIPVVPTVIVPNHVLLPGQTGVPPAPFIPAAPPLHPTHPIIGFAPRSGHLPPIGMARSEVLGQFGTPSVTVITSSGETLYFTGGTTVIIQNGQVAGTR